MTRVLYVPQRYYGSGTDTEIKSQHTKLTLEKKTLPPLLPGFELASFRSRVRRSNQETISALTNTPSKATVSRTLFECVENRCRSLTSGQVRSGSSFTTAWICKVWKVTNLCSNKRGPLARLPLCLYKRGQTARLPLLGMVGH